MIDVSGQVQPCAYRGNYGNVANAEPLGNINEQSLDHIWNGPVARRVRRCMVSGDLDGAGCGKCLALAQNQALGLEIDLRATQKPSSPYSDNLSLKMAEILAGNETCKSRPTVVYYTPDHRCNLSCIHCYQNASRKSAIRSKDLERELIGLVPFLSDVVAGGGEPLILPFWRRFLASAAKTTNPYLRFATTTNATILRDDVLEQLASFDRISIIVSLDGATAETFEAIRPPAKWEPFLANARKLRTLCSSKAAFFSFNISVMKANLLELPQLIEHCAAFKSPFNFQPVVTYPVTQSLRCFNNVPSEMAGWKRALLATDILLSSCFFTAMIKAAELGDVVWDDSFKNVYFGHVSALNALIPWELAAFDYHLCEGRLPVSVWSRASAASALDQRRTGGSVILFYPDDSPSSAEPHFYARLDAEMRFSVYLPVGSYQVNVVAEDCHPGFHGNAWPDLLIRIEASTIAFEESWKLKFPGRNRLLKFYRFLRQIFRRD